MAVFVTKVITKYAANVFCIDKDTKEWGQGFFNMDEFKSSTPIPLAYGKCVVVD